MAGSIQIDDLDECGHYAVTVCIVGEYKGLERHEKLGWVLLIQPREDGGIVRIPANSRPEIEARP